jgi:hypothetical protein
MPLTARLDERYHDYEWRDSTIFLCSELCVLYGCSVSIVDPKITSRSVSLEIPARFQRPGLRGLCNIDSGQSGGMNSPL